MKLKDGLGEIDPECCNLHMAGFAIPLNLAYIHPPATRVRTQLIHQMTVAAMRTAERNVSARLS
jgi:hypothetical protein